MPAQFKVNKSEAIAFAKVWNQNGISMIITDTALDFATDFSNVVLRNFIDMCQEQAKFEAKKKQIMIEGVSEGLENKSY